MQLKFPNRRTKENRKKNCGKILRIQFFTINHFRLYFIFSEFQVETIFKKAPLKLTT